MSVGLLIILLSTLSSKILVDLLLLREVSSLITFHVLCKLPLLASRLSETKSFFASLIALFAWILARLN